ncbi:MAG TPA: SH3 domain-containing protein [Gammaproteobacteria bacterium]|nr:SH3 domain-containing protein [Gammaproteobacteria bacterium]
MSAADKPSARRLRKLPLAAAAAAIAATVCVAAMSRAHTVVATLLNAAPASDAKAVANLAANTDLDVSTRSGGWYEVRTAQGQSGWLVMTAIKFAHNATGTTWGTSWFDLFESGRTGAGGTTATLGVRGLNTGTIENATPAPAAVSAIGAYAVDPANASAFAQALGLKAVKVDYLGDDKEQQP